MTSVKRGAPAISSGAMDWTQPSAVDRPDARVCYYRFGDGEGVLLIQGVGARGEVWRPQVEGLSGAPWCFSCVWQHETYIA